MSWGTGTARWRLWRWGRRQHPRNGRRTPGSATRLTGLDRLLRLNRVMSLIRRRLSEPGHVVADAGVCNRFLGCGSRRHHVREVMTGGTELHVGDGGGSGGGDGYLTQATGDELQCQRLAGQVSTGSYRSIVLCHWEPVQAGPCNR